MEDTPTLTLYTSIERGNDSQELRGFLSRGGFPFVEKNVSARPGTFFLLPLVARLQQNTHTPRSSTSHISSGNMQYTYILLLLLL